MRLFPSVDSAVKRQTYPGWQIPERTIGNHELVLVTSGRGVITIQGHPHPVGHGDLAYFPPDMSHALATEDADCMAFLAVHFTLEGEARGRLALPCLSHPPATLPLKQALASIVRAYMQKPVYYEWTQDLALSSALHLLLVESRAESAPYRVQRALRYIHEHPDEPVSLQTLCALSGLKKSRFTEEFRRLTGTAPVAYSRALRLEKARDMLVSGHAPIAAIAEACGFPDALYFSRQFSRRYGMPPLRYRQAGQE